MSFEIDLMPSALKSDKDGGDTTSVKNLMGRQCVHDVPVTVLPRKLWAEYGEPISRKSDIRSVGNDQVLEITFATVVHA